MVSGSLKRISDLIIPHYSQCYHPGQSKTISPLDTVLLLVYTLTFLLSILYGSQSDGAFLCFLNFLFCIGYSQLTTVVLGEQQRD